MARMLPRALSLAQAPGVTRADAANIPSTWRKPLGRNRPVASRHRLQRVIDLAL